MDQTELRISVVIPAYNEEDWLPKSLQGLQKQDFSAPFEVIVVDNASRDRTAAIAEAFGARVVSEPRRGVAFARQAGFAAATGDLILTTDADTLVPTNWVRTMHASFLAHPEAVAVGGPVRYAITDPLQRQLFETTIPLLHDIDRWVHEGRGHLVGANLAVRRTAFHELGGFRTDVTQGEDLDLSHRLGELGPIIFARELRVVTSDRRFQNQGPQVIWRYFQNYLAITQPARPIRAKITRAFDRYRTEVTQRLPRAK